MKRLYYNHIRRWKIAEKELNATIYTSNGDAFETCKFDPSRDFFGGPLRSLNLFEFDFGTNSGYLCALNRKLEE